MASTWSSFVSLYGEEPSAAWIVGLKDLSETEIFAGYERARDAGTEFPPNLSVFLQYCSPDWEHAAQSRPASEVLLDKPVDRGAGRYLPPIEDMRSTDEIRRDIKIFMGLED